jgi:hypothetical protein
MRLVMLLWMLAITFAPAYAQTLGEETLTNKDVIAMQKAGLAEGVIIAKIRASKTTFDTSVAALQELKRESVPDNVILAMVSGPAAAPTPTAAPPSVPTPAAAASELRFPPRGTYNHKKEIKANYDSFKDRTQVALSPLKVGAGWEDDISLAVTYLYPGRTPAVPEKVAFWIYSSSKDWKFLRNREVLVIADGERIDLGDAVRISSDVNRGSVSEVLGVGMPIQAFLKIANSSSLQMRVGTHELKFAADHYEAIKDFASRMHPEN